MRQPMPDDHLMELVETASLRPLDEQAAYIRQACNGDAELEKCVADYVHWKRVIGDFLEGTAAALLPEDEYFRPGDRLLNRFRIMSEVGRGGMGIVYEAYDETLEKRVALKCAHSGFDRQLVPEVRHASEISHPNVCKIFDIHHARTEAGEQVSFLSMEFLNGPTLADHMAGKPLPEPEAKQIALELCRGLFAAHRNGVIHGDLKTNNIMLARGPDGATRTVITDFGLARRGEPGGPGLQSGMRGGAPLFLAPEVRQGGRPNAASDIFALGVVMYLMLTGRPPRDGRISAKLPPKWRTVISRAMEADPARRYQSADEVARALDPAPQFWMPAGTAAVVLASLLWPWPVKEQVRLAVLPFSAPASAQAAADKLYANAAERISRLHGGKARSLKLIPVEEVRRSHARTPEEAGRLGATHAFTAALRESGGGYVLEAALVDTSTGAKPRQWSAQYPANELQAAPVALAGVVSGGLHVPPLEPAGAVAPAARTHYEQGLRLVRRNSQAALALQAFERAAAADAGSAAIQAGIAEAYWLLYYNTKERAWLDKAVEAAARAERMNPDVAPVRKVAGLLKAHAGRLDEAILDFTRSIELDPTHADAWRRLGLAHQQVNRPADAEAALREAIAREPDYFKPYQSYGALFHYRGEYAKACEQFAKAITLQPDEANLYFALGGSLVRKGDFVEAEKAFRQAARLMETAEATDALGVSLMFQGREAEALPQFERAVELQPGLHLHHLHLGQALARLGKRERAKAAFRQARAVAEGELAVNPRSGHVRAMLAYALAQGGDHRYAELEAAQALHFQPDDNDTQWWAALTYEAVGKRDATLKLASGLPRGILEELSRWRELSGLHSDPRFIDLVIQARAKEGLK